MSFWLLSLSLVLLAPTAPRVSPAQTQVGSDDVPLLLDLIASVLESGAPVSTAVRTVGEIAEASAMASRRDVEASRVLSRVGRLLDFGATPDEAWGVAAQHPSFSAVAASAVRCSGSGARLAGALHDAARTLRRARHERAEARAQRVGVWTMLPLGLCFLPAFVCLGVAPSLIGLGRQALAR